MSAATTWSCFAFPILNPSTPSPLRMTAPDFWLAAVVVVCFFFGAVCCFVVGGVVWVVGEGAAGAVEGAVEGAGVCPAGLGEADGVDGCGAMVGAGDCFAGVVAGAEDAAGALVALAEARGVLGSLPKVPHPVKRVAAVTMAATAMAGRMFMAFS
ncbi:MAG: hypothetical protein Q3997_07445 [Propionibacteriaceae bacterium]|nr:hypothetical protein [Propionibacteriaceae bacterium]